MCMSETKNSEVQTYKKTILVVITYSKVKQLASTVHWFYYTRLESGFSGFPEPISCPTCIQDYNHDNVI